MYSGWESRVSSQDEYRNVGTDGLFHFPGFGIDAVEWLLPRREIAGIGVDTLSLDNGPSTTFDVHHGLLGADRYGVENLRNLAQIPPRDASAFVGLVPWEAGSGGRAGSSPAGSHSERQLRRWSHRVGHAPLCGRHRGQMAIPSPAQRESARRDQRPCRRPEAGDTSGHRHHAGVQAGPVGVIRTTAPSRGGTRPRAISSARCSATVGRLDAGRSGEHRNMSGRDPAAAAHTCCGRSILDRSAPRQLLPRLRHGRRRGMASTASSCAFESSRGRSPCPAARSRRRCGWRRR
jgi:hypothetical protein